MEPLTLVTVSRNYFNMPLWVADHVGFFADEGLDVTVELHEPIDAIVERLRDGRAQVGCGVTEQVILDAEQGGSLVIVGGNVNKLPFDLVAAPDVHSFADMRGRTVGVSSLEAGSSSLVMKLFEAHGLHHPEDYEMRAVGPILARWDELRAGRIQAGLQGIPLNYVALDAGYTTLAQPRETFPDFQFTSLNVDREWARANEDTLVRVLRACVRAHAWFYENREAATDIAVAETGVAREYTLRAWDDYTRDEIFPRDGDASDAAVATLIEVSALIRALDRRAGTRPADYIDRRYLQAARASLVAS
ncbi:ABC transporter substrate-binding protein [Actinomycetospora sp. CA-053990]|uniref:ABC transporter substrate-binding protein n=1 Tax=Actinomycetospora sp. CA-053990 TaxID=3239891 RepID=UPI003D90EC38